MLAFFGLTIDYAPTIERLKQFSIFALDDIKIQPGLCSSQYEYTYTFDNGYEDLDVEYLNPVVGSIGFLVTHKFDDHAQRIPPVFHTTQSNTGTYFLFMNRRKYSPVTYIDTISMLNMPKERLGEFICFRFAYQTYGNVTLKLYSLPVNSYDYQMSSSIWKATK